MKIENQSQALHVVGIELRTSNRDAARTIPPHWRRFAEERIAERVPARIGDAVYAVYTHFEHAGVDNDGAYSLVIGVAVPGASAQVPDGMLRVVAPASARAVFPVERGRFDLVGAAWQRVWQWNERPKTYVADYERYRADGEIELLIGVQAT